MNLDEMALTPAERTSLFVRGIIRFKPNKPVESDKAITDRGSYMRRYRARRRANGGKVLGWSKLAGRRLGWRKAGSAEQLALREKWRHRKQAQQFNEKVRRDIEKDGPITT